MLHPRWLFAAAALVLMSIASACGGDGGGGETPTVPTVNPTTEATQAAINTEEATGEETPTRVPGPEAQPTPASGEIVLATTTGLQESGLLDVLIPMFEAETGYTVRRVALGADAAIEQAASGATDVVLVDSPAAEQAMIDEGNGIERALVMHGDFVLVGPATDPGAAKDQERADDALKAIAAAQAPFISRGDGSDTNALEQRLWTAAAIDPTGQSWYEATGQGMAATLLVASQRSGYAISDRATYLAQGADVNLEIVLEGDPALLDVYHVIVVNPDTHANVNATGARAFAAWITRADVQQMIGEFGVADLGQPVFSADAGKPEPAR